MGRGRCGETASKRGARTAPKPGALRWWATDGRFGAFGRTSVSTGTGAAGVVFAGGHRSRRRGRRVGRDADGDALRRRGRRRGGRGGGGRRQDVAGDVAVGSVTTGGAGVTGTVVPGSLEAGGVAAGSAAVGSELVADGSVVAAGAVADGSGGVAAGSVVADGSVVAAGAVAVGSVAAGAVGSVAVVEVESVDVDVDDCEDPSRSNRPCRSPCSWRDRTPRSPAFPTHCRRRRAARTSPQRRPAGDEHDDTQPRQAQRKHSHVPSPGHSHLPLPHPCPATRHVHATSAPCFLAARPVIPQVSVDARTVKTSQQSGRKRCNIRPCRPRGEAAVDAFQRGGSVRMVEKLRLGRRLAVGAAVIFGVLFAVVGQGAHRAAAIGLDASVVSISGSPEVPEGSTAQFTATITPAAAGDFDVDYTASAGGVSGSFHVTAGDATERPSMSRPSTTASGRLAAHVHRHARGHDRHRQRLHRRPRHPRPERSTTSTAAAVGRLDRQRERRRHRRQPCDLPGVDLTGRRCGVQRLVHGERTAESAARST